MQHISSDNNSNTAQLTNDDTFQLQLQFNLERHQSCLNHSTKNYGILQSQSKSQQNAFNQKNYSKM